MYSTCFHEVDSNTQLQADGRQYLLFGTWFFKKVLVLYKFVLVWWGVVRNLLEYLNVKTK